MSDSCRHCGSELTGMIEEWCPRCGGALAEEEDRWALESPVPYAPDQSPGDLGQAPRSEGKERPVRRRRLLAPLIVLAVAVLAGAGIGAYLLARDEPVTATQLFPVHPDGKTGYIDSTGKMVIEPRDFMAGPFSEGLAMVSVGDKTGFIDASGDFAIEPRSIWASDFHEGLAAAGFLPLDRSNPLATGYIGYIDKTGSFVIRQREFVGARDFSEGLAAAAVQDGDQTRYGFIDRTGAWVIEPRFDSAEGFSEGLAAVLVVDADQSYRWGCIDKMGAWVVAPQFNFVGPFMEGLAAVITTDEGNRAMGYIDKTGAWAIEPRFGYGGGFHEGLAVACEAGPWETARYGYVDKTGAWVIEPQFAAALDFSQGLAAVNPGDSLSWGYIDKTGTMVIKPGFGVAGQFEPGGLAEVWLGDPAGSRPFSSALDGYAAGPEAVDFFFADMAYIDRTGRIVWPSK